MQYKYVLAPSLSIVMIAALFMFPIGVALPGPGPEDIPPVAAAAWYSKSHESCLVEVGGVYCTEITAQLYDNGCTYVSSTQVKCTVTMQRSARSSGWTIPGTTFAQGPGSNPYCNFEVLGCTTGVAITSWNVVVYNGQRICMPSGVIWAAGDTQSFPGGVSVTTPRVNFMPCWDWTGPVPQAQNHGQASLEALETIGFSSQ